MAHSSCKSHEFTLIIRILKWRKRLPSYHTLKAARQQHRHAHATLLRLRPATLRLLLRETLKSPAAPLQSAQDIVATMRALDHRGAGVISVPVSLRVRLFLKRWGL